MTKLPNTLTRMDVGYAFIPLSPIVKFTNLQILTLSGKEHVKDFSNLRDVIFPQLRILRFHYSDYLDLDRESLSRHETLSEFLKNHGRNLKELSIVDQNLNLLNSVIAKFCPNLKSLTTR